MSRLNELNVVALTEDIPSESLLRGQVGTVVAVLADGVYEVEFADEEGCTYACLPLRDHQLMILHYTPTAA